MRAGFTGSHLTVFQGSRWDVLITETRGWTPTRCNEKPDSEDEKLLRDFTQRYFPDGRRAHDGAQDLPFHQ